MKILVTEDDDQKFVEISEYIDSVGNVSCNVVRAKTMTEFMSKFDSSISICIIDLRIPAYDKAPPDTNGLGILQAVETNGGGRVKMLAISAYPEEFEQIRCDFESRGCLLVSFDQKEVWKSALRLMIVQAASVDAMDFLIFCALRAERAPYTAMADLHSKPIFKDNLARLDLTIAGRRGTVIELPRMGLVDAAATAAACIERFKPKLVAMSGICAGFKGRAELGQLLVSELAYEYQSGKWSSDEFQLEPYQIPISEEVRNVVCEILEDEGLLEDLEVGWKTYRPTAMSAPNTAIFTSGSAVIASEKLIGQVANHHRKVSGLDMEVYAIHRAAHIAPCKPDIVCAKTVVDLAGAAKDDKLHQYGASISAKFIVKAVASYFSRSQSQANSSEGCNPAD